ncbi:phage head-tail adaptor, putative, SPP1 family [Sphingomonas gellani]|uniref:Phage head-tail adaptor, putative, SPP1 family n=1 Tax=Sphingomonas gellani TaxID=1166340 RepID=A0A1H7Y5V2_9SPHN|nr:phage head closure protein [Sphingomonas gellani]SEM40688.1 phage head-tail adaptor, putative, SPP1 family [Sphingomonas gellani]
MIDAGALNRRLTLYRPVETVSDTGTTKIGWRSGGTVWAAQESLNLREATRAAGMTDAIEAKFRIRWRQDVTASMEVACGDRRYSVVQVEELGNREGLALLVRAI